MLCCTGVANSLGMGGGTALRTCKVARWQGGKVLAQSMPGRSNIVYVDVWVSLGSSFDLRDQCLRSRRHANLLSLLQILQTGSELLGWELFYSYESLSSPRFCTRFLPGWFGWKEISLARLPQDNCNRSLWHHKQHSS